MRVDHEDERVELTLKLWLREKAILVWARLMEEMLKPGNDGWDKNVTWRHDMTQALGLPLHDVITKNRVINSVWNFMLIICVHAPCE